jgi:N-methylhydantoinase A
MTLKIGVDVGGTFTDFLLSDDAGGTGIFKVLSTPDDPSIGLMNGLGEIAAARGVTLSELLGQVETIVHGTTVTTNAALTGSGAVTGLITTKGVRDALEMRRGIREEQYNNRYTNVEPLVPRYRRLAVGGRLDYAGAEIEPLDEKEVEEAAAALAGDGVEAVAICFMNSFADAAHEQAVADIVRGLLPEAFLSVSSEVLPSIRFYDRVSTTVLNAFVGPKLATYMESLIGKLAEAGYGNVLLIMQSNGGVVTPEVARGRPAMTLLSGPAAGPGAGLIYTGVHGWRDYITVDMGGTSFDAALVRDGTPLTKTEGEIGRHRLALPMLDIVTIGAGGGSVGWIDEGGLLRMGPKSAGAAPGPACYGRGGNEPACTDADLVLGYLDAEYFAGGKIKLDLAASKKAIADHVADPLKMSVEEAAAGMYRVINTNMAHGVREVTVKRGFDPREFPIVVAGGAGPIHACPICTELEIPFFVVPRESSIFCAAGMLLSDLRHDFVRSCVAPIESLDAARLAGLVDEMVEEGRSVLASERIAPERMEFAAFLDMRYVKQYHEVTCPATLEAIRAGSLDELLKGFHAEHNRLYGYSLEEERTPVELINVRVRATGVTEKPAFADEATDGGDAACALKGERPAYVPESGRLENVSVFNGHKLHRGAVVTGPAIIEQVNTTVFVSGGFDCFVDSRGSFVVHRKGCTVEQGGRGAEWRVEK